MLGQNHFFKRCRQFGLSLAIAAVCIFSAQSLNSVEAQAAQNTPALDVEEFYNSISAEQVVAILNDLGLEAQIADSGNATQKAILSQAPGGGRFYIDFLLCADEALSSGCPIMVFRTAMNSSGVSYEDLNQFNISSIVTKAINLPNQNLIAFVRHSVVQGGVGKEQLQRQLAFFISDMNNYVASQESATSVSFSIDGEPIGQSPIKIAPVGTSDNNGVSQASDLLGEISLLTDAAIYNTNTVRFMTDEISALLK